MARPPLQFCLWRAPGFLKWVVTTLFTMAIALSIGQSTMGQVQTGRIVGTVTDPQRSAVADAAVTVVETRTNQSVTVKANERGDYTGDRSGSGKHRSGRAEAEPSWLRQARQPYRREVV